MRDAAWQEDLHFLADTMQEIHPNLFFALSEQAFKRAVTELEAKLSQLSHEQIIVEFIKLVALPSVTGGRDGHSYLPVLQAATGFHALPLKLREFIDGWFVVNAQEPYEDLVGKRLVQVGKLRVEEASAVLDPLVSRDNPMSLKARLGSFFLIPEVLRATGMSESIDAVELKLENGEAFKTSVRPLTGEAYQSWEAAIWQEPEHFISFKDSATLLISYNAVRAKTQSGESMAQFCERLTDFVKASEPARIIVDLRKNGGGNNLTYRPMLEFLSQNEIVNQPDKLFVLIGRDTFSAAGNFATEVQQKTNASFVGEPMGGGVNQYGDSLPITLPNSKLVAQIASRYWQMSSADDERLTLAPDIQVELSSTDFFADVDPVLAALLGDK